MEKLLHEKLKVNLKQLFSDLSRVSKTQNSLGGKHF